MSQKLMNIINVVFIGESGVGKTSIMNRLLKKEFSEETTPTCGHICEIEYIKDENLLPNTKIRINYWDTPGQERFHSMNSRPIKNSDIIIFIIDNQLDNLLESKEDVGWIKFVEGHVELDLPEKKVIFCLNKTDLIVDDKIKSEKLEYLNNILQTENLNGEGEPLPISAKNSDGILTLKLKIKNFAFNIVKSRLSNHKDEVNIGLYGPSLVGKTSLLNRIINDDFQESTILTFKLIKKECFVQDYNSHEIKLNYYDIPGQKLIMEEYIDIMKKIEIILFVNDNDNKNIEFDILKKKNKII